MTADPERIKNYVNVSPVGCEMEAHKRDVLTPEPVVLKPNAKKREVLTMDDVTDFPH